MQVVGGRWAEAVTLAREAGAVRLIGPAPGDTTPLAGQTNGSVICLKRTGEVILWPADRTRNPPRPQPADIGVEIEPIEPADSHAGHVI
jgi:hypothetical protein